MKRTAQFVDALFANAGVTPSSTDRNAAIGEFGAALPLRFRICVVALRAFFVELDAFHGCAKILASWVD
jgi:hypothetical protein